MSFNPHEDQIRLRDSTLLSLDPELSRRRHMELGIISSDSYFFQDSEDTCNGNSDNMNYDLSYGTIGIPSSPPQFTALSAIAIPSYDPMQEDENENQIENENENDSDGDTDADEPPSTQLLGPSSTLIAGKRTVSATSYSNSFMSKDPVAIVSDIIEGNVPSRSFGALCDLSRCGLTQVPEVIRDLSNFVCLEDPRREMVNLDLSHNRIELLPDFLFQVDKIQMLNLTENLLTEISPAIDGLQNLREISVSGNNLKALPIELYRPDLTLFLKALGNNFRPVPDDLTPLENHCFPKRIESQGPPSLRELTLRALIACDDAEQTCQRILQNSGSLGPYLDIREAHIALKVGRICSHCRQAIIRPTVTYTEWRQFAGDMIAFEAKLCSMICFNRFHAQRLKGQQF